MRTTRRSSRRRRDRKERQAWLGRSEPEGGEDAVPDAAITCTSVSKSSPDLPDIGLCRVGAGQAYVLRFEDRSIKCGVVCCVSIWPNDGPPAARLVLVPGRASSAAEPLNRRGGNVRYGTGCVVSGGEHAPRCPSQGRVSRSSVPDHLATPTGCGGAKGHVPDGSPEPPGSGFIPSDGIRLPRRCRA